MTKDGAAAELLTSFSKRDWKDLTYLMDREEMARDQARIWGMNGDTGYYV